MKWLRIWIPSWRLFDQVAQIPHLYVKRSDDEKWLSVLKPPSLRWFHIFVNPEGGYHHAACNAVEALVQNPKDQDAYRIVCRICRRFLLDRQAFAGQHFQFKVSVVQTAFKEVLEEDTLLSAVEKI